MKGSRMDITTQKNKRSLDMERPSKTKMVDRYFDGGITG